MVASSGMNIDQGRARLFLQAMNCKLIMRSARRRQGIGQGEGARAPVAPARRPVDLVEITHRTPNGKLEQLTPLGWKTARGVLPPVLARLDADHPHLIAANGFAVICERIGSIKGAAIDGACGDTSFGVSDGGATTKMRHAEALWQIRGAINKWPVARPSGRYIKGDDRVVVAPIGGGRKRQEIKAFDLVFRVCIEGQDMGTILKAHGYSAQTKNRKMLRVVIEELLDLMATECRWHMGS